MTQLDNTEKTKTQEIAESRERAAVIQAVSIEVGGAIPHPQLLSQYNAVIPDGANRIVKLAEGQVHHRQVIEARGQIFAFVLAIVTLGGGIALIGLGAGAEGLVSLVATVAGLAGLFAYREVQSQKRGER